MGSLKKKLLKNLAGTYCRLKPSKHGIGVFAIRDIPKNTNPFSNCREVRWLKFKQEEINFLSQEIKRSIKEFYGSEKGVYYIPTHGLDGNDISFYMNHSTKPNVSVKKDGHNFITFKKILAGEELLLDYRAYDPEDKILS